MGEPDVRHQATAEERADPALGPIEELVGHEDIERLVLLLEAADGARRQQALHAEYLEAEDVGPEIQLGRQNPVSRAVAREKGDALPAQGASHVRSGRIAERRGDRALLAPGQLRHLVQAAPSNDANLDADVAWSRAHDSGRAGSTRRFPCSSLM